MKIRRAKEKDLQQIKALLDQVDLVHHNIRPDLFKVGRKYTDAEILKILQDEQRPVFAAVDETDTLVGYAFCIFICHQGDNVLTDIKTLYLDDLCVDETRRGERIGKALYEHVTAFAKEQGCYNVTLNVWEKNDGAKKFYESMGMQVQKTCMETIL